MNDKLLLAGLISNLFYSIAYPVIHTVTVQDLDSRLLSTGSLLSCILVICINKIWLNESEKLYKKFSLMLILESVLYFIVLIMILTKTITLQIYYLIDMLFFATITRSIICGGNKLKAIRYKGISREEFDNKSVIYCNVASIIGFAVSALLKIQINIAFLIMYMGIISDNFIYYIVYKNMADMEI